MEFLFYVRNRLIEIYHQDTPKPIINNQGYAFFCISNSKIIRLLKADLIEMDIPLLERKWEQINLTEISRQEESTYRLEKIKVLLDDGVSQKQITQILGVSPSCVSNIIKKHKLKE